MYNQRSVILASTVCKYKIILIIQRIQYTNALSISHKTYIKKQQSQKIISIFSIHILERISVYV